MDEETKKDFECLENIRHFEFHAGFIAGAEQMRERAIQVADRKNENTPAPSEMRSFDCHVAAKAMASVIADDLRALPLEEEKQ